MASTPRTAAGAKSSASSSPQRRKQAAKHPKTASSARASKPEKPAPRQAGRSTAAKAVGRKTVARKAGSASRSAAPERAKSARAAVSASSDSQQRAPHSGSPGNARASARDLADRMVDNVLGQNVLSDFRPSDLIGTARTLTRQTLRRPLTLARASLGFFGELGKLAAGESSLEPEPGDRRFSDPAWRESALHAGVLQAYLALRKSMERYATTASDDPRQIERAQFLLTQIGNALAPTNFPLLNPAATRRALETRGLSVARGVSHLVNDVIKRRPIPSQVDESAFTVGGNLAVTPGAVVLRTDMFELIQYAPQTEKVHRRPVLIVPSIVNKYYVFDLAPGRSVVEYYVQQGLTVFVMVWRNPQRRHDIWGMADYITAIDTAIDATSAITASPDVNLWAVCGAGPVAVSLAGHYAAKRKRKINSLLLVVSPLDMQAMSNAPGIGAFADQSPAPLKEARKKNARKKRISAREFTLLFAMLRSNELIWNYWVNNYLLGDKPSAFDVMYWNADGTGMTAQFNQDFSAFVEANPFVTPGAMKVRGKAIADLADLDIDSYVLGAANDHLCIWQGVYRSAQMLGKRSQFVLGNSGHVQTIVCPPGNPKASFCTNDRLPATPEEWLETATLHGGSWWDHGVAWTKQRAGTLVAAPRTPGNRKYPALCDAPGTYVLERG